MADAHPQPHVRRRGNGYWYTGTLQQPLPQELFCPCPVRAPCVFRACPVQHRHGHLRSRPYRLAVLAVSLCTMTAPHPVDRAQLAATRTLFDAAAQTPRRQGPCFALLRCFAASGFFFLFFFGESVFQSPTIPYHTIPYHTIPYHTSLYDIAIDREKIRNSATVGTCTVQFSAREHSA